DRDQRQGLCLKQPPRDWPERTQTPAQLLPDRHCLEFPTVVAFSESDRPAWQGQVACGIRLTSVNSPCDRVRPGTAVVVCHLARTNALIHFSLRFPQVEFVPIQHRLIVLVAFDIALASGIAFKDRQRLSPRTQDLSCPGL